jgi:hypothetical protein
MDEFPGTLATVALHRHWRVQQRQAMKSMPAQDP